MGKYGKLLLLSMLSAVLMTSCYEVTELSDTGEDGPVGPATQTIIVFMPWATNLYDVFQQNITDIEKAIVEKRCDQSNIIVCIADSERQSHLIALRRDHDQCVHDTLATYSRNLTDASSITGMLRDVETVAPAPRYAMIIGCHGMGWLPVGSTRQAARRAPMHYERTDVPQTRWFGGMTAQYQIDITTLADAVKDASMHMEYILFDDCFMSSIEVAYDLKDVTDYLIACPTEIMMYGFPYHACIPYIAGEADYEGLCREFVAFYSNYSVPSGTIGVTDCRQLDELAEVVREINAVTEIDNPDTQEMDGYTPTLFYDLGDCIKKQCADQLLLDRFSQQLKKTVPYKGHTERFYSAVDGYHEIKTFSGVTTSAPSRIVASWHQETAWYMATH